MRTIWFEESRHKDDLRCDPVWRSHKGRFAFAVQLRADTKVRELNNTLGSHQQI